MKTFIKKWFIIGESDLFGDLLRITFPIALIIFVIFKILGL